MLITHVEEVMCIAVKMQVGWLKNYFNTMSGQNIHKNTAFMHLKPRIGRKIKIFTITAPILTRSLAYFYRQ